MNDQPRHGDLPGQSYDMQTLRIVLDIVEDICVKWEDLSGPGVLGLEVPCLPPAHALFGRPALHPGYRGPGYQGANPGVAGGVEDGNAAAPGVAHETEAGGRRDAQLAFHEGIDNSSHVVQLGGEGVTTEVVSK